MWSQSYSKRVSGVGVERIWAVWTDVNQWHTWHTDIEYARIEGEFKTGNTFVLKPKGGPKVVIEITQAEPFKTFTDLTHFFGAKMAVFHEFNEYDTELEINTKVSISGALAFFWRKIVAEKVANDMEEQTRRLIEMAGSD